MFTSNQTFTQPPSFRKGVYELSYFFKRLFPLFLVCFVTFSNSTSGQVKNSFSSECGCGSDKECKFKGPDAVCPGSYNTYCIHKKVKKGYTYEWSVYGDGCFVPSPEFCHKECVTIRAKNSCDAKFTVKLKIKRYGKTVSECKKVVWVGDKEKPKVKAGSIASCYLTRTDAEAAAIAATLAWDNCTEKEDLRIKAKTFGDHDNYGNYCNARIVVKVTDNCWNSCEVTYYTRIDNIKPTITCPANVTVQCNSQIPATDFAGGTVSDNCDPHPVISHADVEDPPNPYHPCLRVIHRTYRATDACGNYNECTQTITVNDTQAPTITCPANVTVQCNSQIPAGDLVAEGGTVSDNCDPHPTVTHVDVEDPSNQYHPCLRVIHRTYTATDACKNSSTCTQTITVNDTQAPTITCPADVSVQCGSQIPPADFAGGTVSDNCDPNPVVTHVDVEDPPNPNHICLRVIHRTYTATDACKNSSTCTQTITVNDTQGPEFHNVPPKEVWLKYCGCPFDSHSPIAIDNCDGPVPVIGPISSQPGGPCTDATNTWTATDLCGNISTYVQTIHIPGFVFCPNADACKTENCASYTGPWQSITSNRPITSNSSADAKKSTLVDKLSVTAYPNPYTDQVNFRIVSPVTGKAVLEVYNQIGQKLGVAYNGNIYAGETQTVNYKVPVLQRVHIMYRLTVGNLNFTGSVISKK